MWTFVASSEMRTPLLQKASDESSRMPLCQQHEAFLKRASQQAAKSGRFIPWSGQTRQLCMHSKSSSYLLQWLPSYYSPLPSPTRASKWPVPCGGGAWWWWCRSWPGGWDGGCRDESSVVSSTEEEQPESLSCISQLLLSVFPFSHAWTQPHCYSFNSDLHQRQPISFSAFIFFIYQYVWLFKDLP